MEHSQQTQASIDFVPFHNVGTLVHKEYVEANYDPHGAIVIDNGIDIRVDWDGDGGKLGRFEVKTSLCGWEHCKNLAASMSTNDLIYPTSPLDIDQLVLRFQRGPDHSGIQFKVRAFPISWKPECAPAYPLPSDYVAKRGIDYVYEVTGSLEDDEWWRLSVPSPEDGIQRCTLELAKGTDYEVWVSLQSPTDPSHWLPMDPIVDSDKGGTGPR